MIDLMIKNLQEIQDKDRKFKELAEFFQFFAEYIKPFKFNIRAEVITPPFNTFLVFGIKDNTILKNQLDVILDLSNLTVKAGVDYLVDAFKNPQTRRIMESELQKAKKIVKDKDVATKDNAS